MAILKTDTRFTIETLIAIARTTASPTMREELLEEALQVLRTGEVTNYRNGAEEFLSHYKPSDKSRISQKELYEKYTNYVVDEGLPNIGKHLFYKTIRERGYRIANHQQMPMIYIQEA